jgi:hypothetical protein
MSAREFRNKEDQYLRWLNKNLRGFVLTTGRDAPTHYMSLHRSYCKKISTYAKNMNGPAFTGKQYIKICANDPFDLLNWIIAHGGKGFTLQCAFCKPNLPTNDAVSFAKFSSELEREVRRANSNAAGRRRRLQSALRKPESFFATTIVFKRNADVIAEVLERAAGDCEHCHKPAPFLKAKDGTPYLEVHHKVRLADEGEDTVQNAIAVCPNCHRQLHHG